MKEQMRIFTVPSGLFIKHSEVYFEDFFSFSSRMMRYCGYDFRCLSDCISENERKVLILKNVWFWTLPLNTGILVFLILLEAWQSHDMGKLALAISATTSFSVYAFITNRLKWKNIEINNFLEELKQDFHTRSQLTRNACMFIQKLSVSFIVVWLFVNLFIWLFPLISFLFFGRKILFYPVPDFMLQDCLYPFAFLWMNLTELFAVLQTLTLSLIIVTLILFVCLKFDQLAHDISAFKHSDEFEIVALLSTLIERHINALELAKKLNRHFSVIFLVRFVASIFAIGIDFFAILSLKNQSDVALGFTLIMSELSQLFLICCVSQMLVNANNRIATSIYDCGWENWTSLSFKKSILMILQKSQDPATLTIWKFGSISLKLFTSLAKSIYDITSFLLAIYENNHSGLFIKHSEVYFEDFFSFSSRMMRYCGYDFRCLSDCLSESERKILILKNVWFWLAPTNAGALVSLFILEAWQSKDIGKLALAISATSSFSVYIFIISLLQWNKVQIFNFLEELKQNFPIRNSLARKACLSAQKLSVAFVVIWLIVCSVFMFLPFISTVFFEQNILSVPVPDFMLHGFIYPLAYLWTTYIAFFTFLQTLTLSFITVIMISIVCLRFDQLACDFTCLKRADEIETVELLSTWVKEHICALESVKKLDVLFSIMFLVRFVVSIFAIGIDFFAILSLKNLPDISLGLLLIMSELSQLFLICCVGQMLVNANNRIATSIYDCGWENWTSLSLKKSILMILRKSQDPATLTIWKFGSISLKLFTSLAKSMYDITSFMMAIYENKD
ncbi:hypothetical protein PVAND_003261 [Polypedilum vanderplanki]|uniref:Odorant receptor n=1 Tax=Polypedilum vanderplanki TaxID=319348 RepID=A0A9J6BTZ4_POLVA|nr:hypothetical protein PVAND_003261 [Polypedilum vanderplanki]